MESSAKITVIIPLYNKEKNIQDTLNSVLKQTFENYEIIIVNDGSTDTSLEVVNSIKDTRIKIINKVNGGVSSARNEGIKRAKGEWIALLDGDDLWRKNHLSSLISLVGKYPGHFVFTNETTLTEEKIIEVEAQDYILDYFVASLVDKHINSSSCLIHKSCFEMVGLFNEDLNKGEDLEMWYRLAKKYKIVKSSLPTVVYKIDAENRAMGKTTDYKNSFASKINLKYATSHSEKTYLKSQIKAKYKSCLYNREWLNLWKCFRQHKFSFV